MDVISFPPSNPSNKGVSRGFIGGGVLFSSINLIGKNLIGKKKGTIATSFWKLGDG